MKIMDDFKNKISSYDKEYKFSQEEVLNILERYEIKGDTIIPYLMHKELDIPLSECKKAYDVAIDYLRSQGKVKG